MKNAKFLFIIKLLMEKSITVRTNFSKVDQIGFLKPVRPIVRLLAGFSISITMFLILTGCTTISPASTPSGEVVSATGTVAVSHVSPTQTPLQIAATPSAVPNKASTVTSTATVQPPTPTSTSTVQPTATKTPMTIPTPPGIATTEQVLWLLETNNGCQLPCWWGITPGQTTWNVAELFFDAFVSNIQAASSTQLINYSPLIPLSPEVFEASYTYPIYTVRNGIVQEILTEVSIGDTTPSGYLRPYILSTFLTTYGEPSEVWLFTYPSPFEGGDLPFFVILIYPDQGIIAMYDDNGEVQGNIVKGCPQEHPVGILKLWAPNSNLAFEQIIQESSALRKEYLSIEEATEMDVTTFYETFKNPDNTICLETRADLWD